MDIETRLILSKYEKVRQISDNGKSSVYMVADNSTGHICVMKELPISADLSVYHRLKVTPINNIPKIIEIFKLENCQVVIEEYIKGENLDTKLETSGKLAEQQVIKWTMNLCDILTNLHEANPPIIHRDIKPGNIIITDDGIVKLIDFDISRSYKETVLFVSFLLSEVY